VSFLRTVCAYVMDSETKYWVVPLWMLHLLMIALHRIGARFMDIFAKMQWYPGQRSWCIRFSEMCLEKVTWFSAKHDVASEAVKKFSRILLRSCTERIDPVTCQNYFARLVNSARRDFFSRLDVCCHTVEIRALSTNQPCIIKVRIRFPLSRHVMMKLSNLIDD